jgi:cell shape-determining protein MreC
MSDTCKSCGTPWLRHNGIEPTCAQLQECKKREGEIRPRLIADCERLSQRNLALEEENKALRKELTLVRTRRGKATEAIERKPKS